MQSYLESVRQNIAGQGKVLELGGTNGTGFSVSNMHSISSKATVHSVHSSGYHSSTSSQGLSLNS